ncbi:SDR family NAD(P)-dependent oxidoreductase [Rhizobium halophytocola]|uniref:NAD(P)-dependent dehydrogenase (Short-subunit alcohol dehydrogenase family) n=1 Tax=Rhizobium halophytocola TaxID=735519 RepID=A0ABS4DU79_9HYPH|nr:SDR family NAD(P)-dependent oxidoreductase [Rhizobium halophytocola]MBP1849217.1 NAD(P)-dependent dehydrogenase (short-subunit alcohol dehydrogenase family) [Rhizobium halophytocola]
MPTILITGANRGIGLEFARQYASAGWQVIATARQPAEAHDIAKIDGAIRVLPYDALDDDSADALAATLKEQPIDVIVMNAGTNANKDKAPEDLTIEDWNETLLTNTFAPLYLAARLRPNLEAGERKTLAAISSLAASSTYAQPREFAYSASKAALNQMWRNLAVDWRPWGCKCVTLRPGRVQTRMTGFDGDLTPEQSVAGMRKVIDGLVPEQSGSLIGYDGIVVPW